MMVLYDRRHRMSIDEPATIHDLPDEVLRAALAYLDEWDLASAS
jgi:hypothetical protein